MKKILFALTTFAVSLSAFGQDTYLIRNFERDFALAANLDFKEEDFDRVYTRYESLIFPREGINTLFDNLTGDHAEHLPLLTFKEKKTYKDLIGGMLSSDNPLRRDLAYITIGSSGDTSFNDLLFKRLKSETRRDCLKWAAMCLFYNHNKSTDQLLEFIVSNQDFGNALFVNLYMELDPACLKATAWKNINSNNRRAQVISLQVLAAKDKSKAADTAIIHCIETWENKDKVYAITSLLQRNNIDKFDILKPYLNDEMTKGITKKVLEQSISPYDKAQIEKLKKQKKWD